MKEQVRIAQYLKQVECGNHQHALGETSESGDAKGSFGATISAKQVSSKLTYNYKKKGSSKGAKSPGHVISADSGRANSGAQHVHRRKALVRLGAGSGKATQRAQVTPAPGIGCLAKDGEIADCSKDPAVVKEAIKLIEKSPQPNAAVRLIQRSNGRKQRSRKPSRGRCIRQTSKLAKRVKDLERQLESKPTRLAKTQLAMGKTKKSREVKKRNRKRSAQRSNSNLNTCTVAKICDPIESGRSVKISKAALKAECLMH